MDEELRTYLALCDDADADVDYHLAQLALPTRSPSPWPLTMSDDSGSLPGAAHSCGIFTSLSHHDVIETGTELALSPSALEDRVLDGKVLLTNIVIPENNQAVSLSPVLRQTISSDFADYTTGIDAQNSCGAVTARSRRVVVSGSRYHKIPRKLASRQIIVRNTGRQ